MGRWQSQRMGALLRDRVWARAGSVALLALLWLLPLRIDAQTPAPPPTRLPAPASGVIYFTFGGGFAGLQVGTKYGFIDTTGKAVIAPQFDDEGGFAFGFATVKVGDKWGYIDTTGKLVIAPQFEDGYAFSDVGLARVMVSGKWGFIDRSGAVVIPPQYDDALGFGDELPITLPNDTPSTPPFLTAVKVGEKWGYIDTTGKTVIAPQFDAAHDFTTDQVALVKVGDKWGFINKVGAFVIPAQYDDGIIESREGLAGVKVGDLWGFADTRTGALVIPPRFDNAASFVGGVAPVATGGQIGFIRPDGTFAIPPRFVDAYGYIDDYQFGPNGLALVGVDRGYGQITRLGDAGKTMIAGPAGFIDRTGNFVIPPRFDTAGTFADGLAYAEVNGKGGFIDRTGTFVIPPQFAPDPNLAVQP